MSNTRDEIRNTALVFGWQVVDQWDYDMFYRGEDAIDVYYNRADTVIKAAKYRFFKVDDLHVVESILGGPHKKARVRSWLAESA